MTITQQPCDGLRTIIRESNTRLGEHDAAVPCSCPAVVAVLGDGPDTRCDILQEVVDGP